jgi:hypothetical protein
MCLFQPMLKKKMKKLRKNKRQNEFFMQLMFMKTVKQKKTLL